MTATEELRQMLSKLGAEWTANDGKYVEETCWSYMGELSATFTEYHNGVTRFGCDTWCFTPAKAIEATLGRGECKNISSPPSGFLCSECGWGDFAEPSHLLTTAKYADNDGGPNFCPNCGRKVVG